MLIDQANKLVLKWKLISLYILSASVVLRFDYLFGGANRFIPFRIILILTIFWIVLQFFKPFRPSQLPFFQSTFIVGFLLYFSFSHFFWIDSMESFGPFLKNQFHFVYILSAYFLTKYLVIDLTKHQVQTVVKSTLILALVVVSLETILRYTMPTLDLNSENSDYLIKVYAGSQEGLSFDTFYFFKVSSIMFFDSNYVGAFLLIFFALNQLVDYSSPRKKNLITFILVGLIFLTLSRAAILMTFVWLIFNIWNSRTFISKWVFALLCVGLSLIVLIFIQDQIVFTDGSFLTKLQILEGLSGFFEQDLMTSLFGLGYEVGGYLYSYMSGGYAHIHVAILLGELGLIGTLVYLSYWYFMGVQSGPKVLYLFIPFLIIGFSLADPWEVGYFWASALISKI